MKKKNNTNFLSIHELYKKWEAEQDTQYANEKLIEWKQKMSNSLQGKSHNLKIVICPYCKKEDKGPNMSRYHFENCKYKKI